MAVLQGIKNQSAHVDEKGQRTYTVDYLVRATQGDTLTTIYNVTSPPNVPAAYQGDSLAMLSPEAEITPLVSEGGEVEWWLVKRTYKTNVRLCHENANEDPLLQPPIVRGSFTRVSEEQSIAHQVRWYVNNEVYREQYFTTPRNSAHEVLRGPQVEADIARPQIQVTLNLSQTQFNAFNIMQYVNAVNMTPMWGFPPRTVRLTDVKWEHKFYGNCYKYYTVEFTFDVFMRFNPLLGSVVSGWDRFVLDEGTKVLRGRWNTDDNVWIVDDDADRLNPADFIRYKDPNGELTRVVLDGKGEPCVKGEENDEAKPGLIEIRFYRAVDFLTLGFGFPNEL